MLPLSVTAVFTTMAGTASAIGTAVGTDDDDLTVPFLLVIVLVVAVSFSPRIPLDLGLLGRRRFDIRIEDLVLVVVLLSLVLSRSAPHSRIELPRYFVALLGYFAIATVTTTVGIATTDLSLFRGFFYLLKEVEYGLIALAVANVVRSREQLYMVTVVFVGCALVNAGWADFQLLVDSTGPLFQTVQKSGYYGQPVGASGTALIGEPSRLSSGGFYLAPLFLACSWLIAERDSVRSRWWGLAALALAIALVASLSRASIFSAVIALFFLILFLDRVPNHWLVTVPSVGLLTTVAVAPFVPVDRFKPGYVLQSITTRFGKWDPIVASLDPTSLVGDGKGSLTIMAGVEEAHNFYLRLFVETGLVGLLAFVVVLLLVVGAAVGAYQRSNDPVVRAVCIAAICTTLSVATAALFQDAFINVKLAESYWLLVGALGSALRLAE